MGAPGFWRPLCAFSDDDYEAVAALAGRYLADCWYAERVLHNEGWGALVYHRLGTVALAWSLRG